YERGIYIPDVDLWLDPWDAKHFAFVSHAHSDHIAPHEEVILSERTARHVQGTRDPIRPTRARARCRSYVVARRSHLWLGPNFSRNAKRFAALRRRLQIASRQIGRARRVDAGRNVDYGNDVRSAALQIPADRTSHATNCRFRARRAGRRRRAGLARLFVRQSAGNFVRARRRRAHSDAARLRFSNDAHLRTVRPDILQIRSLQA